MNRGVDGALTAEVRRGAGRDAACVSSGTCRERREGVFSCVGGVIFVFVSRLKGRVEVACCTSGISVQNGNEHQEAVAWLNSKFKR